MKHFEFWLKLCIFNFFIVSVLGVMMRYNIAFSLPFFNHKLMQESHSHFAFYGWVSASIYLFVTKYLSENSKKSNFSKYQLLMMANQIASYGMLFSFLYGGYFWLSIVFASVALFTGFVYFAFLLMDTAGNKSPEIIWLKSGAFFAVISSIGIFGLAYFSARKEEFDVLFRASTYFYLHYQYNGFFLFSCIGLLLISLKKYKIIIPEKRNKSIFYLLFIGCFFGYGLSILWVEIPVFLSVFFTVISLIQLLGVCKLLNWVVENRKKISEKHSFVQRVLLAVVGLSFLLKFLLQSISTIPALGSYAFNNLNLIIAYLHLVLLMGISLFLIWNIIIITKIRISHNLKMSVLFLMSGIILNEIVLFVIGIFSIFYIPFLSSAYWLLLASGIIMVSIALFIIKLKN